MDQGIKDPVQSEFLHPTAEVLKQANIPHPEIVYQEAAKDLEGYWARRASALEWYQQWDTVLDESHKPFYQWFAGGKTNIVLNALVRHVKTWRRNKLTLICEGDISTLEK
jgi:acetyl-CoA synthetase